MEDTRKQQQQREPGRKNPGPKRQDPQQEPGRKRQDPQEPRHGRPERRPER